MCEPHGKDPRRGRFPETGRIHLVTTVTDQRRPWFLDLQAARLLIQTLRSESRNAETLAFVVMPDHLHWLMTLRHGVSLSAVLQNVKSISSHRINRMLARRGRLWQAGFHEHVLRAEEDPASVARYVIANPIRAGLASSTGDYPHWDSIWL